jgi:hypothetical protein
MLTETDDQLRLASKLQQACNEARLLWLDKDTTDLTVVENIYRSIWEECCTLIDDNARRKSKVLNHVRQQAGERLSMLLLQSGRHDEATNILIDLGYTCRLSSAVLNYPTLEPADREHASTSTAGSSCAETIPCRIHDNFLTANELECFQSIFQDPNADYWTDHKYAVEPPSPYFSYLLPLSNSAKSNTALKSDFGIMGQILERIRDLVAEWKPLVHQCTYVEMWAHNRPHATGHQLHFDSDNEGIGDAIRNPLVSTILYLSGGGVGGPSLITNQRRTSRHLADQGWYIPAVCNRLVAFDGKVLHGVVPGKGSAIIPICSTTEFPFTPQQQHPRRVTLMLAFWKRIHVRELPTPGAARPFPTSGSRTWATQLLRSPSSLPSTTNNEGAPTEALFKRSLVPVVPATLEPIYETVHGEPWTRRMGIPEYDCVFQGF